MDAVKRKAVLIEPIDNVLTVLEEVAPGEIATSGAAEVVACEDIPLYHKVALKDVARGEKLYKYGQFIGFALTDIKAGQWVHTHNLDSVMPEGGDAR